MGEFDQFIGRLAHRRDNHDHAIAVLKGLPGFDGASGAVVYALRIGHGRSTVFLNDHTHRENCIDCVSETAKEFMAKRRARKTRIIADAGSSALMQSPDASSINR